MTTEKKTQTEEWPAEGEGAHVPKHARPVPCDAEPRRMGFGKKAAMGIVAGVALLAVCAGGLATWTGVQRILAEERAAEEFEAEERAVEERLALRSVPVEVEIVAEGWDVKVDGGMSLHFAVSDFALTPDEVDEGCSRSCEGLRGYKGAERGAAPGKPLRIELRSGNYEIGAKNKFVAASSGVVYSAKYSAPAKLSVSFPGDAKVPEIECAYEAFEPEGMVVTVAYEPVDMAGLSDDDALAAASASSGPGSRAFRTTEEALAAIDAKRAEARHALSSAPGLAEEG